MERKEESVKCFFFLAYDWGKCEKGGLIFKEYSLTILEEIDAKKKMGLNKTSWECCCKVWVFGVKIEDCILQW